MGRDKIVVFGILFLCVLFTINKSVERYEYNNYKINIKSQMDGLDELYEYYSSIERIQTPNYALYCVHPTQLGYIRQLAMALTHDKDDIDAITKYMQSFTYKSDYASQGVEEYPQFPVETIYLGTGDCEDFAILGASLFYTLGYDVALLRTVNHMFLGLNVSGFSLPNYEGYYPIDSTSQTTIYNFPHRSDVISIHRMKDTPILFHQWDDIHTFYHGLYKYINIDLTIYNYGTTAYNITLRPIVMYDSSDTSRETNIDKMESFTETELNLVFKVEYDSLAKVYTYLLHDGEIADIQFSQ